MYTKCFFLVFLSAAMILTASGNALAEYELQQEIQLTNSGQTGDSDNQNPAVAYNWRRDEYLVVSHSDLSAGGTDVIASRVSSAGSRIDLGTISSGNRCENPDVAYDHQNDRYLIVWHQYSFTDSRWEIHGRIIPWNGPGTSTPFLIASWGGLNLEFPAVAFGNNSYMVVWQILANSGIGYRMVAADGILGDDLKVVDPGPDLYPDITYNMTAAEYLVVWAGPGNFGTGMDIFGRRLDLNGTQGPTFSINSDEHDQKYPAVATNTKDRYLVVWQDDFGGTTDWDIKGQFLDVSGRKIGSLQKITETSDSETRPALTANSGIEEYIVVWERKINLKKGIWGRLLYTDEPKSSAFEIFPPAGGDNEHPAVGGHFVTYSWDSSDPDIDSDIYGRMLKEKFEWVLYNHLFRDPNNR